MANANAIRIRSTKKDKNGKPKYPVPSARNLAHNAAKTKATYWLNDGDKIIQSKKYENTHQVNEDWIRWENEARERYKNNPDNKRLIKSNAVLLEEGLIIIGTDVKATTKQIVSVVKDFVSKFEKDNNTKVRHWAYHDHEGYTEDGEEKINRHIHFIFDNVSNYGVMVRRNWAREYLTQLQTDIFEISKKYIKDIERGQKSTYEEVQIGNRIVKINTKKQIHHRAYRKKKELEAAYNFRQTQKEITANENLTNSQKKELHRLNTKINRNENGEEKDKEISLLRQKITLFQEQNEAIIKQNITQKSKIEEMEDILQNVSEQINNFDAMTAELSNILDEDRVDSETFFDSFAKNIKSLFNSMQEKITILTAQKAELEKEKAELEKLDPKIDVLLNDEIKVEEKGTFKKEKIYTINPQSLSGTINRFVKAQVLINTQEQSKKDNEIYKLLQKEKAEKEKLEKEKAELEKELYYTKKEETSEKITTTNRRKHKHD